MRKAAIAVLAASLLAGCLISTPLTWQPHARAAESSELSLSPFMRFKHNDGKTEAYYTAGDDFLVAGFALLDEWWTTISRSGRSALRGHSDNALPAELKLLGHKPADVIMRSFANYFFGARLPRTGLIPFSYDHFRHTCLCRTGGLQPVYLIERGAEFARWFPNDLTIRQKLVELADATIKNFDYVQDDEARFGLWGWVDSRNGRPAVSVAMTQDYGAVARAMAYVTRVTGDARYEEWARQKTRFVWEKRMNKDLPVLCEWFIPTDPVFLDAPTQTSDTDVLYYVRYLFDLYHITGRQEYRDQAMAVTDLWFANMWNEEFGHWLRKMKPDGTPAVDTIYGDGKYNTINILIEAYRLTGNKKYADRIKATWEGLLRSSPDGLVPEALKAGEPNADAGPDRQQTMFIQLLLDAYEVTEDDYFLSQAVALGDRVLKSGKEVMRLEGGNAGQQFLRLATAQRKIRRLEIALGQKGAKLEIVREGENILSRQVPAEIAVIYLPDGTYDLKISGDRRPVSLQLPLRGHKRITFALGRPRLQDIAIQTISPYRASSDRSGAKAFQPQ